MLRPLSLSTLSLLLLGTGRALANQVLTTSGFSTCLSASNITVQKLDITYDNDAKTVTFDVAGTSLTTQNVTAVLNVTGSYSSKAWSFVYSMPHTNFMLAYGTQVYQNSFNPCDSATYVQQLCPGKL